ncbi:hypothetical protein [Streptomyces sp. MUSC 14]|uniref:hypothetical protein n=1 Tax=Streptomyces sp. MUSC 14 TaxID=1354889 RepID=UPI0015A6C5D2|nr:hypothetical protein [Streptomyces sp. MUSC 14]
MRHTAVLLLVAVTALLPSAGRARRERRLQRRRRHALWLAAYGIDVGPRRIHGVEVRA